MRLLRIVLAVLALSGCAALAYLAGHVSEVPAIFGRYSVPYFLLLMSAAAGTAVVTVSLLWGSAFQATVELWTGLLVSLTTTVLLLAVAEVAVRTFDVIGISYYEALYQYDRDRVSDPDLVYKHQRNHRAVYEGILVETNELGLRDGPLHPRDDDEFRILALGDSVTFGWGVRNEDTFPRVLEQRLRTRLDKNIRVVNAGVGSYNTEQEAAFLRLHADTIRPDAVLLTVVANDIIMHEPLRPSEPSRPQRILAVLRRAWTYRLAAHLWNYGGSARPVAVERAGDGWVRAMAALTEIIEKCAERRLPLAVVMYEHVVDPLTQAVSDEVRLIAGQHGVPFASTREWLKDHRPGDLVVSLVDSHLNAKGNRLLAEGLSEFLREHSEFGLLPTQELPSTEDEPASLMQ